MKPTQKIKTGNSISFALKELLLEGSVGTQDEICQALKKQGFPTNQSKVSRLLNKIGAVKITDQHGRSIYRLPHAYGLVHELSSNTEKYALSHLILDVVNNAALIVIHTTPGAAGMVAREIDLHHVELGALGAIAGDDTIFVAPKDLKAIKQVIESIKTHLQL